MKQIYIAVSSINGYSHVMKYLDDITSDPQRECIEQRVEIIKFFDDYGEDATRRAFGKSRSTVYLWKQKLKQAGGKLSALAPGNRAPIRKRRRIVDPFVRDFIIRYRTAHPRADKTTITPALAAACESAGVRPVSESTVGRIIHDLKERRLIPKATKLSINGRVGGWWPESHGPSPGKSGGKASLQSSPAIWSRWIPSLYLSMASSAISSPPWT